LPYTTLFRSFGINQQHFRIPHQGPIEVTAGGAQVGLGIEMLVDVISTQVHSGVSVCAKRVSAIVKFLFFGSFVARFVRFHKFFVGKDSSRFIRISRYPLVIRNNGSLPIRWLDEFRKLHHKDIFFYILFGGVMQVIVGGKQGVLVGSDHLFGFIGGLLVKFLSFL